MAKVLLVEDDNNLREIFEMRLQAEGYQTVTASDGEQALATAVKDKPDLIIADVMMPKLSGFEMLETLRSRPEMQSVKVIMMTALGAPEDIAKGEKLGVTKYLVKSQVTLEDFVRVVRDVLPPDQSTGQAASPVGQPIADEPATASVPPTSTPAPQAPSPPLNPMATPPASTPPPDGGQMTTAQESNSIQSQINDFAASPPPAQAQPPDPVASTDSADTSVSIPLSSPPKDDQTPPGSQPPTPTA